MAHDNMIHNDMSQSDKLHEGMARPVCGEIMSAAPQRTGVTRNNGLIFSGETETICEAQFETLPQASQVALAGDTKMRYSSGAANFSPAPGMELLTTSASRTRRGGKGGPLFWLTGLSAIALTFWISGGHALVAAINMPAPTRSPLQIAGVASRVEARGSRNMLFVDGRAENHGNQALIVPAIEIAVTGNDGVVTRYHLAGRETRLEPGHRREFSSRLQAPGGGVKIVSVAFAEERR